MEITLAELLDAREERVLTQKRIQNDTKLPLICFTMNIAGPIKTSPAIVRAFKYGLEQLENETDRFKIVSKLVEYKNCGPVAFFSVDGNASEIKDICVKIEESCPLGRLFDLDVLDINGSKLERENERGCIICGKTGRSCSSRRVHSVEELQSKTCDIIKNHFSKKDSSDIAEKARLCLVKEVNTTVKPGLVDRLNNGSHTDMTVDTFKKSALAIKPYFEKCITIGIESSADTPDVAFERLRKAGIQAETDMYQATDGINTHKGIIFSMGVILGALGRLWKVECPYPRVSDILNECSKLTKKAVEKDFEKIDGSTAGGRLYLLNGNKGIRGETQNGFPSVKNIALPAYKAALNSGKNENDAGIYALLHLIANIYDTSIYNRGGEDGVKYARERARDLLIKKDIEYADLVDMDKDFINRNLSPGGSADLLAITYFLADLEKTTKE